MNKFSFALAAVLVFGFASVGNAAGLTAGLAPAVATSSTNALKPLSVAPVVATPAAAPMVPVLKPVAPPTVLGAPSKVTVPRPRSRLPRQLWWSSVKISIGTKENPP